jgi:hypothetical protein
MSQFYSDPAREAETYSLPDCETFFLHSGPRRFYDRSYVMDYCTTDPEHGPEACDDCPEPGWYYQFCFPGCLPESDPVGPYKTEAEAIEACRDEVDNG